MAALVGPYQDLQVQLEDKTKKLLTISLSNLVPLYEIEMRGGG